MPTSGTMTLFMLAALALNLTPGPPILFILSRCMSQGRSAGIVSALGMSTAALVHAAAVAFGLSALLVYSPLAFGTAKLCGAAYLIHLGIRGFMAGGGAGLAARVEGRGPTPLGKIYRQGLLTDLANPKVLIFFVSFLPQFVEPARGGPTGQMLVLGLLFQATALPTNLGVALLGGSLAAFIARHPLRARIQNWLSSAILIGLGIRLALSRRG